MDGVCDSLNNRSRTNCRRKHLCLLFHVRDSNFHGTSITEEVHKLILLLCIVRKQHKKKHDLLYIYNCIVER